GGKVVDVRELARMLDFLKGFADGCHHGKEENILFPAMEKAGIPREHGPIGVMLGEHELGRKYIRGMGEALEREKAHDTSWASAFASSARAYRNLLTQHIEKENNILFPMADIHIAHDIQVRLSKEFEKLELERVGVGKHEEYHELLKSLKAAYL
ncbi:MAG: hemerythrin domain-containing protein, partial [Bacteroidota bacterium]